jgi:ferredoxin--NADP+ reductase
MATVFVVGAGPAGLFAGQKLALAGHEVVIFNRDIKPGGLAEYGIYPLKEKMKAGLRKQFAKVLSLPNVHYFGHVPVRSDSAFSIDTLRGLCPAAIVFAVGAQGTKKLGLVGESAAGIFSAKDFVYHYNQLPPFGTLDFSTRKRVAVVGMGNVMVDIARWLLRDNPNRQTEEVVVLARRGPLEAKFDEKEFANIQMYLDRSVFYDEMERVKQQMTAAGQDVSKVPQETFPCLVKYPDQQISQPRLTFRFLTSPFAVLSDKSGRIARLVVSENTLINRDGKIEARTTLQTSELDVDSMIVAIGDKHDPSLGLPCGDDGYTTNPESTPEAAYQVYDRKTAKLLEGMFVAGWARKPSEGLVGIARHDGEVGAVNVLRYLNGARDRLSASAHEIASILERKGIQAVSKSDLVWLSVAEEREAELRSTYHKFSDDASMLAALECVKVESSDPVAVP